VATQAPAVQRKTRWSTPPPGLAPGPHAQPYRRRRPETTTLHRIVREQLETYLALANEADPMGHGVPDHVEKELRSYLKTFPLTCPSCQAPLTFIAFLTHPDPISQILVHIGEPTSPPLLHPARGPPQTELHMGPGGPEREEVAQEPFPDDLDQTPDFDPAEPDPVPQDHFDQSQGG